MRAYVKTRCDLLADYIIRTGATVRDTAKVFGVSKSTVHKDLTERLPQYNRPLSLQVQAILQQNKAERHIRGGQATRRKYMAAQHSAAASQPTGHPGR